jgi:hypothetical protein
LGESHRQDSEESEDVLHVCNVDVVVEDVMLLLWYGMMYYESLLSWDRMNDNI